MKYEAKIRKQEAWLITIDSRGEWIGIAEVVYTGRVRLYKEHFDEVMKVGFRDFREPLLVLDPERKNLTPMADTPRDCYPAPTRLIREWNSSLYNEPRNIHPLFIIPRPEFEKYDEPEWVLRDIQGLDFTALREADRFDELVHYCGLDEAYRRLELDLNEQTPFFDKPAFTSREADEALEAVKGLTDASLLRLFSAAIMSKATCYVGELHQYQRIRVNRDMLVDHVPKKIYRGVSKLIEEVIINVLDDLGANVSSGEIWNAIAAAHHDESDRYDRTGLIAEITNEGLAYVHNEADRFDDEFDIKRTSFPTYVHRAKRQLETFST